MASRAAALNGGFHFHRGGEVGGDGLEGETGNDEAFHRADGAVDSGDALDMVRTVWVAFSDLAIGDVAAAGAVELVEELLEGGAGDIGLDGARATNMPTIGFIASREPRRRRCSRSSRGGSG